MTPALSASQEQSRSETLRSRMTYIVRADLKLQNTSIFEISQTPTAMYLSKILILNSLQSPKQNGQLHWYNHTNTNRKVYDHSEQPS